MSISLPGSYLYYLAKDDLAPEEYERIISPFFAWSRICKKYEFDDTIRGSFYIINIRERPYYRSSHQPAPHGLREKARLKSMVESGDVVMLSEMHDPGSLFYINDEGKLICTSYSSFRHNGTEKILHEYDLSVGRRDYRHRGGKPRPTVRQVKKRGAEPHPEIYGTINSKTAGRLLAAGGIYNQNPEMYAVTARKLGGEAAEGFEQILNEQSAGTVIAVSSLLSGMKRSGSPHLLEETKDLQKTLRGAERAAKFAQNWPEADLSVAVEKFAGSNPVVTMTDKGKRIYTNQETGIQVVEDTSGGYFRIFDPSISGKRAYLDLDGNIPNNKTLENGTLTGRSQSEYNEVTHFKIKGEIK